ncbi:MAG: helix-turn-helix domain-containing protein [bacterium]|nr:helix-turn-helix domain-containing protein [bacterium]
MTNKNIEAGSAHLHSALKTGLSAKAASVYVALLEAGMPLSPKNLITKTGLYRQYVYDALHELEGRQLVIQTVKGHAAKYQAASPDRLLQEAEKQRLNAMDGVGVLMKLYDRSPAGLVEIIRGSKATVESELQLLRDAKEGDFLDVVGGAGMHWVRLFGERVGEWEKLRKEKNIKLRYIGGEEDVRYNKEKSVIEHESRMISGIGEMVNVAIRPESVSFNIYEPEIVTVRVKNTEAVKSQRALFEILWGVAK